MFRSAVLIALICASVTGCLRPDMVKVTDVDPLGWQVGDAVRIEMLNTDTTGLRRLDLLVRFDQTFDCAQLPLTVRIDTPDSLWHEERFTATFGDVRRVNNDFFEAAIPFRDKVLLNRQGTYVFRIANAGDEVRGIWGAGFAIVND